MSIYTTTLACWCNFFLTLASLLFLKLCIIYISSLHNRACCGLFEITVPRLFIKLLYQNHCTTLFLLLDSIFIFWKNVLPKCDESIFHPPLYLKILPHILHVFLLIPFSYISSLPFYNFLSVLSFPVCVCFLTLYSIPIKNLRLYKKRQYLAQ